ncbi:hypothetical protein ILYODFUR_016705 [Ilyodon furcidens]|uniref:Uncharacterized protein n=1 Tax=Ilyodon furcidens TaxID=33524 RepID=A0ABV0TVA0_9TELE
MFSAFLRAKYLKLKLIAQGAPSCFAFPSEEKHPHSMMLPLPCFTVGIVYSGGFHTVQGWSYVTREPSPKCLLCPHGLWQIASRHLMALIQKWLFLKSVSRMAVLSTDLPISAVDLCSSPTFTMDILQVSLNKAFLALL